MGFVQVGGTRSRRGRGRARVLALVLSLVAVFATTGQTLASDHHRGPDHRVPVDVYVVGCDKEVGGGTGMAEVPSGTRFNITWDWQTYSWWQEAVFLFSVDVDAAIDGMAIAHPSRYWTRPFYLAGEDWPWRMFWKYPSRALKAGQSITFTVTPTLQFPVFDGTDWYPRGSIGTLSCKITGV